MPENAVSQISEFRFQQLTEAIDLAIWVSDARTREVVYVSSAYERIWGRSCEEFKSQWDARKQWVHPDDAPRVFSESDRFFASPPGASYDLAYRIIRPDGAV